MARKDYIPDSYKNLRDWAQNILDHLDPIATRIGWPAALATSFKGRITRIRDLADAVLDQQAALDTAIGQLERGRDTELPEIRTDLNNLKSTRGFTDGDAKTLDVLSGSDQIDPATYQPRLAAEGKRGRIELMGKKFGADSLNLYVRRKGETTWRVLAAKRVRFPMDDDTPSASPNGLEEREYMAIGVLGDDEIGQPSPIVTATFTP
jgi:hypothetical protein